MQQSSLFLSLSSSFFPSSINQLTSNDRNDEDEDDDNEEEEGEDNDNEPFRCAHSSARCGFSSMRI